MSSHGTGGVEMYTSNPLLESGRGVGEGDGAATSATTVDDGSTASRPTAASTRKLAALDHGESELDLTGRSRTATLTWSDPSAGAPLRRRCCGLHGRKKHAVVAAILIAATCAVGVLIAVVLTHQPSPLALPKSFQANVIVTHKSSNLPEYSGIVHKIGFGDGDEWQVSVQVTLPSATEPTAATVVTAIDNRLYLQLVNTTTGRAISAPQCAGPHAVPPLGAAKASLEGATVVAETLVGARTTSRVACVDAGREVTVLKWAGQTYLSCSLGDGDFHVEGMAFTAAVRDMHANPPPNPPFSAPVDDSTGAVPECPQMDIKRVIETATSNTRRRLSATGQTPRVRLLAQDWYVPDEHMSPHTRRRLAPVHHHATLADARAAMARRRAHTQAVINAGKAVGHPEAAARQLEHTNNECCNCRRRRRLATSATTSNGGDATVSGTSAGVPDPDEATALDVLSFWSSVLQDDADGAAITADSGSSSGSGTSGGGDSATVSPRERLMQWFQSFFGKMKSPGFCVCCLIPGIETPAGWRLPNFCTETVHMDVDVSKVWDDHEEQVKLCNQLTNLKFQQLQGNDGTPTQEGDDPFGMPIRDIAIFGLSSGNLMLAGAMANRTCGFTRGEDDVVWTVVEGLLNNVDDPYLYCSQPWAFAVQAASHLSVGDQQRLAEMARTVTGRTAACQLNVTTNPPSWVPTPALLAMVDGYPGLADAVRVIAGNATAIVANIQDIYNITYNTNVTRHTNATRSATTGTSNSAAPTTNTTVLGRGWGTAPAIGLVGGMGGLEGDPASEFYNRITPQFFDDNPSCKIVGLVGGGDPNGCTNCFVDVKCDGDKETTPLVFVNDTDTASDNSGAGWERVDGAWHFNGTQRLGVGKIFSILKQKLAVLPTGLTGNDLAGLTGEPYWGVLGFTTVPGDSGMVDSKDGLLDQGSESSDHHALRRLPSRSAPLPSETSRSVATVGHRRLHEGDAKAAELLIRSVSGALHTLKSAYGPDDDEDPSCPNC